MKNDIRLKKYVVIYMAISLAICWILGGLYAAFYDVLSPIFGEAEFTNPGVLVAMCSPTLAALIVYGITGGKAAILNLLKKFILKREHLFWIPVIICLNLLFFGIVHYGSILIGEEVPEITLTFGEQMKELIINLFEELGIMGGVLGWVGFIIPYFQTKYNSNIKAGIAAGLGVGLFVIPGYAISAFGLVALWPLYVLQMVTFMILYSYIFNLTQGNLLLYVILLWINSSGSRMQLYYFAPPAQILQLSAFALAALALHLYMKKRCKAELVKLPEYIFDTADLETQGGQQVGII